MESARYRFEYRVVIPPTDKPGEPLSIWVPYPVEDEYQKILKSEVISPFKWELRNEKKYGNRLVYIEGRTNKEPAEILFRYEVERKFAGGYSRELALEKAPFDPLLYKGADRLVPLDRQIRQIAKEVTRGIRDPEEKVRALYRHVVSAMTYDKSGTGWGNGDAVWACTNKRGNCTDFHSFFIALARTQGIPARFVIGIPIPQDSREGTIPGYHCWAEAFLNDRGWIPLDASEGKKSGQPEDYFGKLPFNRIQFTVGRDIVLDPPQKGEPLNYFIYPYAELNGREFKDLKREFRFEKLS
jgi:transglutaminase-like putative cysteine protease